MKIKLFFLLSFCWVFNAYAQTPTKPETPANTADTTRPVKIWDRRFGGSASEDLRSVIALHDGGFLLGGESDSGMSGDITENNRGKWKDFWIVRTDSNGIKLWDKRYGGDTDDGLKAMLPASDGGYLLGGYSSSAPSADKTAAQFGGADFWLVKINADGTQRWDKTYGSNRNESLTCMIATADGGYLLGGVVRMVIPGDMRGAEDYWVVKIDANGNKLWDKRFGGNNSDNLSSLLATKDGGYLLGGSSISAISGDRTSALLGADDFWVVKIDANGNKRWDKAFGGRNYDNLNAMVRIKDGGYLLGGSSGSGIETGKTAESRGSTDYWLVKIDENGTKLWDKAYGGTDGDFMFTIQATADGGFILGGNSTSRRSKDKTESSSDEDPDYWVVKIDKDGKKGWDKTIGSYYDLEALRTVILTQDGGYLLGGYTSLGQGKDKTQTPQGGDDFWIVKIKATKP